MVKCPFCGFDNEDGALFCEQCKSDLGAVASTAPPPVSPLNPDSVPMADVIEAPVPSAPIIAAHESIPMAAEFGAPPGAPMTAPMAAPAFPPPASPGAPVPPPPRAVVGPAAPTPPTA